MEYVPVSARFKFFNGKNGFTVEYAYGLAKWYIFNEEESTNAIYVKEDKKIRFKDVNKNAANDILNEYLNQ